MSLSYSGKTQSRYTITVTFDNYSVYEDYYLKQFSSGEKKCSKAQWESDMEFLDQMVDKIKNKKEILEPDVYDFCRVLSSVCDDWLKTVKFEKLSDYITFIASKCDESWFYKFNETAEKAVLKLMHAINKDDYVSLVSYLTNTQIEKKINPNSKYGMPIHRFMNKFDDRHLGIGSDNYTNFVSSLIEMYQAKRDAFVQTNQKNELELYPQIIDLTNDFILSTSHSISYDNNTGLMTLSEDDMQFITDQSGILYSTDLKKTNVESLTNVSPFTPIYFKVVPDDPTYVKSFEKLAKQKQIKVGNEWKDGLYLECPLIFVMYRQGKVTQRNLIYAAAIVGSAVMLDVAAEYVLQYGVKKTLNLVIEKTSRKFMFDFLAGAACEYMCTHITCAVTPGCEIHTNDLYVDMAISGLQNAFKLGRPYDAFASCFSGLDINDLFNCAAGSENAISSCIKVGADCGISALFSVIFSSPKLKGKLEDFISKRKENVLIFKRIFAPNHEIQFFKTIFNYTDEWADAMTKFANSNPNIFKIIQEKNINYGLFDAGCLEKLEKLAAEIGEDEMNKLFDNMANGTNAFQMIDLMYKLKWNTTQFNDMLKESVYKYNLTVNMQGQEMHIGYFFNLYLNEPLKAFYVQANNPNIVKIVKYVEKEQCGIEILCRVVNKVIQVEKVKTITNGVNYGIDEIKR